MIEANSDKISDVGKKRCKEHFGEKSFPTWHGVSVVHCWQIFSEDRHCVQVKAV